MGREVNVDLAIRAAEKQIEGGNGDVIKLKRARNSLLNICTRLLHRGSTHKVFE